jgi:hypothetical protein
LNLSEKGSEKLEATGIIRLGSSRVLDTLNKPDIGLNAGVLIAVALPNPVTLKSKKMFATKSDSPVLLTYCISMSSRVKLCNFIV